MAGNLQPLQLFEERSSYFVELLSVTASERITVFTQIHWKQEQSSNLRSIQQRLLSFLSNKNQAYVK